VSSDRLLFAGILVSDYEASRPWFESLLGREPSFLASDTEAVWELSEHGWLYVKQDPGRAGQAELMIVPEDLDDAVRRAAERGIAPVRHEDHPGGVRKIVFRDPDGNEIGFGGGIG
jgi:catechol 2,3-dioxygenase-like lactoylglutathione lyase family enzyme